MSLVLSPALDRMENALRRAANEFAQKLHRHDDPIRRAMDSVLRRLNLEPSRSGGYLSKDALETLRRENRRLSRLAHGRVDARYDLNRHIAVRRLLDHGALPASEPAAPERPSGRFLNARFSRPQNARKKT